MQRIELKFEQLPQAISQLCEDMALVKQCLLGRHGATSPEPDQWFNLIQLCAYLPDKPAKATVYGWVNKKTIPYHKKAKALSFLKSEIDAWLKQALHKTTADIMLDVAKENDAFLSNQRDRKYQANQRDAI